MANGRWWRAYDEALDDPKVQCLQAEDFRGWFNLLCLAARNGGRLPPLPDIAFALRMTTDGASTLVERLRSGGLIDSCSGGPNGSHDAPHGWSKRQYKSDTSTERVKRFRNAKVTAKETPPETESDTDTERDNSNELSTRKRSKTEIGKPDDVDQRVWDDFNTLRKKKGAPVTATALDRIRSEAIKAGISLSDALTECCGRGWQGFKADWYLKDQTNGRQLQLAGQSTLRGSRPDPSLDLLRAARAAEEEERTGGSGSDNWGTWVALPSSGGG